MYCLECDCIIDKAVYNYSTDYFGVPLCRNHQNWLRNLDKSVSDPALELYFALKESGVPAELEQFDGFKTVDIVIEKAKVHIEVDGIQHAFNGKQALIDLRRTFYSFKKGYFTLRIPNALLRYDFEDTVDCILDLLDEGIKKQTKRRSWKFKLAKQ